MPRAFVLATLVACSAPTRPPTAAQPPPAPSSYCPAFAGMNVARPWMWELFPACPTPPFGLTLPVCDGPCPAPCKTTVEAGGMRPGWGGDQTFAYDDRGRFLSSTRDGKPALACTWSGDHLSSCTDTRDDDPVITSATRDAAGRLTALTSGSTTVEIVRDPAGVITSIGGTTFTYDANRLARFTIAPDRSLAFSYDAQGRLSTLRSGGTKEDDITYTTFAYDCR
jgi:YD repeat-containing protein